MDTENLGSWDQIVSALESLKRRERRLLDLITAMREHHSDTNCENHFCECPASPENSAERGSCNCGGEELWETSFDPESFHARAERIEQMPRRPWKKQRRTTPA